MSVGLVIIHGSLSRNRSRDESAAGTADKLFATKIISCRSLLEIVARSPISRCRKSIARKFDCMQEDTVVVSTRIACAKRAAARPINARLIGIINFYRGGI